MVRYVRVLKIEKRSEPARGALLFKIMIDSKDFYSYICRRVSKMISKVETIQSTNTIHVDSRMSKSYQYQS